MNAEDSAWADAYAIAWVGACNPVAVEKTMIKHMRSLWPDHPAVRAICGHLSFLRGCGLGPSPGLLDQLRDHAIRLGILADPA